jgi:hypothetical protein
VFLFPVLFSDGTEMGKLGGCMFLIAAFFVMQGGGEDGTPPLQPRQGRFLPGSTGGCRLLVLPRLRGGIASDGEEDGEGGETGSHAGQDFGLRVDEGSLSEVTDVVPPSSGKLSKEESEMPGAQVQAGGRKRVKPKPLFFRSRPDKSMPFSPRREAIRSALTTSDFPTEPEESAVPPEAEAENLRGTSPEGGRPPSSAKSGAGLGMFVEDSAATDKSGSLGTPSARQGSVHEGRPAKTPSNRKEVLMQLLGE